MESEIAADAPLDYVTFRILPENRYDACISSYETEEQVGHGPLDQLLEHIPSIKDQIAKGSCDNFKLVLPNTVDSRAWFTKATLIRFLHIICSSDIKKSIAISNEMSQLEETRKFHLSLYTQADGITSLDTSKNELLRAMDSRLAALTEELNSTFSLAAGATISFQEMTDLQKFCQQFGDLDVRNLLSKLPERSQKVLTASRLDKKESPAPFVSKNDYINKIGVNTEQPNSVKPVKYNASPAKAAELERQSSSESEDSSFSSEDDQPPAERSRTLIRSASPRRSASPMRKIQIGRSGSRRTPALAIKSLPYIAARERLSVHRDPGNDCDFGESEELIRKTEVNVTRMSVQDAISLFERKQKDEPVDAQKKPLTDTSSNTNKAVLRRWSSGMGESQKFLAQNTTENTFVEEDALRNTEVNPYTDSSPENPELEDVLKADMESDTSEKIESKPNEDDGPACQTEEVDERLDSSEWNRQKEAELNQMLMKFAQYSLSNQKTTEPQKTNLGPRLRQKGGNNGLHREKKDEKLTGEIVGKRVGKQTDLRGNQKAPDKPKAEKSSAKLSDGRKKQPTSRSVNGNTTSKIPSVNKNSPMSANSKKESTKAAMPKKPLAKSSPLPATRKSWPSTPSPRTPGAIPAKISTGPPSGATVVPQKSKSPTPRPKPLSPAQVSRPSPKLERPQLQQKDIKKPQVDTKKNMKKKDDSKSSVLQKSAKTMKTKAAVAPEEDAAASPAKAIPRKKVTKKSSVVPLEAKPSSIRKVSKTRSASISPIKVTEIPAQAEKRLSKCEDLVVSENVGTVASDTVHAVVGVQESEIDSGNLELETNLQIEKPQIEDEAEISAEAPAQDDDIVERMSESPVEIQAAEELVISPAAWEESSSQDPTIPNSSSPSPANPDVVAPSGTRVRHSLSQMLLEETSEPDIIEWGNAENPPAMIYQKDAPKGLKRLLKFARKNKGEANGASWASPYTSEGEDDGDEHRSLGKRHSDSLLKVALHSKNHGEGFLSDSEPLSARSNASNSSTRSSNKFQEGHGSKGTRSFFSLSAFRGNKN